MSKKLLILAVSILAFGCIEAAAQMSDNQITSYIAEGMAAGKTENQIGNELLAKGVSMNQLKRLIQKYRTEGVTLGANVSNAKSLVSKPGNKPSRQASAMLEDDSADLNSPEAASREREKKREVKSPLQEKEDSIKAVPIYGHDVFNNKMLSFEPNENAATPAGYVIGPGDALNIDVWGLNEASVTVDVTPEGVISLAQIGQVAVSGLTIEQATAKISKALSKKYSLGARGGSQLSVTLARIRTIRVNILGEVNVPGSYRLSAFTTVFNALYRAKGITAVGSLRNVNIVRGGKTVATVDLYKYLFEGASDVNVSLMEDDAVIVPAYTSVAMISGGVRRPLRYEMREGETIDDLVRFAGGFSGDANPDHVFVERKEGRMNSAYSVSKEEYAGFALKDCDQVTVGQNEVDVFANMVEVRGAVYMPGKFELGGDIATVRQLVEHAGGLLDDAFLGRAQIFREKADRTLEIVAVPIKGIMEGIVEDMVLRKSDILVISKVSEVEQKGAFTISGFVTNPGEYEFADNTTVEDLILMAGGLSEGASYVKVDVARRISNPYSKASSDTLAQIFSFAIKDGLMSEGDGGFILEPNDIVAVRRSPTYVEQITVTVSGEVTFPGQYTLSSSKERLSDLIARAGGPTVRGDLSSGMLRRKIDQYERNVRMSLNSLVKQGSSRKDSVDVKKIKVNEIYPVGVEIDKAVANPGSDQDIVLRDGDEIIIPPFSSTVRIQGEVLYPNTVRYLKGKNVAYYVNQSGGFANMAKRSKVYVIHMNGTISVGLGAKVEPGCEIVVPSRPMAREMTTGDWMSIGTTAASITTMIATIANMLRR